MLITCGKRFEKLLTKSGVKGLTFENQCGLMHTPDKCKFSF